MGYETLNEILTVQKKYLYYGGRNEVYEMKVTSAKLKVKCAINN